MSKKPLKPLIQGGGFLPSDDSTPLVYPGGRTTLKGNNAGKAEGGDQNTKAEEAEDADR